MWGPYCSGVRSAPVSRIWVLFFYSTLDRFNVRYLFLPSSVAGQGGSRCAPHSDDHRTVRPRTLPHTSPSLQTMVHDKKTKIFCTMGPACWDVPTITSLIDAGMNTARLNFSHGDHAAHGATMDRVKEAAALRPGAPR